MKKLLLILFLASTCQGAEFLVKAEPNWMESRDRSKWSADRIASYERCPRKGDIIVVKPNGWKWGKKEGLPKFIIVKVPDMTVKEAEAYLDQVDVQEGLQDDGEKNIVTKKICKYNFTGLMVDNTKSLGGKISVNKTSAQSVIQTKTVLGEIIQLKGITP